MKLTINMRLQQINDINENQRQKEFAKFLLQIEDRTYPIVADIENKITLPSNIVVAGRILSDLINNVYSDFIQNSNNINYLTKRAILTSKNSDINIISDLMIDQFPGPISIYPSANSTNLANNGNVHLYSSESSY